MFDWWIKWRQRRAHDAFERWTWQHERETGHGEFVYGYHVRRGCCMDCVLPTREEEQYR